MDTIVFVYGGILAVGIVLFVVSLIFGEIGDLIGGGDTSGDSVGWFSTSVLGTACIAFGGTGLVVTSLKWDLTRSLLLAFTIAFVATILVREMLKLFLKQQSNSLISESTHVGRSGTITIRVEPGSVGEVRFIDANNTLTHLPAVTDGSEVLSANRSVTITRVDGGKATVEPTL